MSDIAVGGGRDRPEAKLTPAERAQVARLFSDPTYFPPEFRVWLKNYIEAAGISVSASQIRGSNTLRTGMPPGIFILCGASGAIPPDALACDGRAVSRNTFILLFQKIGTTWGAGDGSTTFNLPDARDRALFGAGSAVGAGATDGQAYGSRGGPRHSTSKSGNAYVSSDPTHRHTGGREVVSLQPGSPGNPYSILGNQSIRDVYSDYAATGIAVSDNITVGPPGLLADAPNWAGAVVAITTGQTG